MQLWRKGRDGGPRGRLRLSETSLDGLGPGVAAVAKIGAEAVGDTTFTVDGGKLQDPEIACAGSAFLGGVKAIIGLSEDWLREKLFPIQVACESPGLFD